MPPITWMLSGPSPAMRLSVAESSDAAEPLTSSTTPRVPDNVDLVVIANPRVKLGEAGSYIETVRGIGYKIGGENA